MVEVKLCVGKLDGTTEYRRISIPVITRSTDVLSVLRGKLPQLFPELTSDKNGIDVEFQYEGLIKKRIVMKWIFDCLDDVRGLVLVTTSEGINETARDQASRQQLLRVFVKFLTENRTSMKYRGKILPFTLIEGLISTQFFNVVVDYNCIFDNVFKPVGDLWWW